MLLRHQGKGRRSSGKILVRVKGMSEDYPRSLDHALEVAIRRAKVIFPAHDTDPLQGVDWITSLIGPSATPVLGLNLYCLSHQVNAICLTRFSIHIFCPRKAGIRFPHNPPASDRPKPAIDSG